MPDDTEDVDPENPRGEPAHHYCYVDAYDGPECSEDY